MHSRLQRLIWMLPLFAHPAVSFASDGPDSDPAVSITNTQGEFVLSWPLWARDWELEQTTDVQPLTFWRRVSPRTYESNAVSRYVRVSTPGAGGFYRLRKIGPPLPGVTGHWQLDEGTGAFSDERSNSGTMLFFTNTTWATGRIGPGALRFNGGASNSGSRAWVSNAGYRVLPPSGQPFSLSLWFSPDALAGQQLLIGSDADGTRRWHVALDTPALGTNYLVFGATGAPGSMTVTGRTLLLPGQWHELTITHDGGEGKLYLDSRLLGRAAGSLPTHEGPIYFGGGIGNYNGFLGRIDDIRTYTNCLTHEEISLTGHWRFDEDTGAFITDSSIRGHHGTMTDALGWAPGRNGSGLELNVAQAVIRNDQYTVLPGSGGSFSVSFWLRPDSLANGRSGLMSCGNGASDGWQLAVDVNESGQTMVHLTSTNSGGTLDLVAPVPLTNGVWTKLDTTYNGGIATIYADGRKVQARNGAIRGTRAPLVVGVVPGTSNFHGVIDDFKIYNRERDATEIGPVATTMWETAWINTTTNIHLQGFGPVGRPLTYTVVPVITPTNGTVSHSPGSSIVAYEAAGGKGPDAFTYTVSDGEFTSAPAIVTVSVVKPHWLSPGGAGEFANGSSPGQAWQAGSANALDAIWKTNNYYDCFFYARGVYETRGWKFETRGTANPGCKHIGSGATGASQTVIRLVDSWDPAGEGCIFATRHAAVLADGFEVHEMTLDCNAANNPQYVRGDPVWVRIPLVTNSRVDSVALRWFAGTTPGAGNPYRFGHAAEFRLCTREFSGGMYVTNCTTHVSTGDVDVVTVDRKADELLLYLDWRAADVDFYALAEVEVLGAGMSLPTATIPGGAPSQFHPSLSILKAVDSNPGTFWASGPESQVTIVLPLARGARVTELDLHWNCITFPQFGRLGAAAGYSIRARDENTGQERDVPFVRHALSADGRQRNTFGTTQATEAVVTDQLTIVLTNKESLVDFYSLREATLWDGFAPVSMRLPAAHSTLQWGQDRGILFAFDEDSDTCWASGTQGMVGAIFVPGNNMKFTHLKVIGFGTKAGRECFPVAIAPLSFGPPKNLGNVLIEDCLFCEPAANNTDGITTVSLVPNAPDTFTNAVIRRTVITGLKPFFDYSHGFTAVHVEDCVVQDCEIAVYFEPDLRGLDDVGPVLIRSNRFVNVIHGINVLSFPGSQFDSITCLGNEIVLTGAGGWGLGACDVCGPGPSASIRHVTALDNIIRYPNWLPRPLNQDGGIIYSDIQHGVFANNLIALGTANGLRVRHCPAGVIYPPTSSEDCDGPIIVPPGQITHPPCLDILPTGYRRAWSNNRDLSGNLLDVLFWQRGVDGKSSQQQWAE